LTKVWGVCALAVLIDAALSLGADPFLMPRLNLVIFAFSSTLVLTFNRWLAQRVRTARFGRPKVLLVGNPDDIDLVESHLDETDRDAIVVGRRGPKEDLLAAVTATEATDVLLLSGCDLSSIYPNPLGLLETRRIGVYQRLEPSDTLLGLKKTRQIAGVPFVAVRSHALPPSKAHLKRVLDIFYIVAASPLILPLVGLLTLYTRLVAGGPAFYRQTRIGRYDEPFTMVKFRTMYPGSEDQSGPVLATIDDERIIPAMRWMRAMRLDELPQLWNVLRGEMSLVGPRPERPELAEQFEMLIPGYGRRHDIRPGLTGLAQVNGHYHTDPGYKLGHDLQYLVNWSPIADLQVLLRSIVVVLSRRT
jgi:lipopolysaccharide/colanic/teichoic acid biosynthesis glycosyltransferase